MTFLPIAARELVVAARRPATYRLRTYGVLLALIVFCAVSLGNIPAGQFGHLELTALGIVVLGFSMLAGLLLTANSIAAEREGGTIGLLFLTDLKGYDIVLGKLAAHAVSSFLGLLSVFPVLALPLLMGGVTGSEFARLLLVFATTLFFSLCLGLAVSAMTSDPKKALGWALMLMAVMAGLLPGLWWLQKISLNVIWLDFLLWPSPAFAFRHGFDAWYRSGAGPVDFWRSVQTLWLMTLLCLVWASFITPRSWQTHELTAKKQRARTRKSRGWEQAEADNPFCRVTILDRSPSSLANLLLGVTVPIWLCFLSFSPLSRRTMPPVAFIVCLFLGYALHLLVKLMMIMQSVSRLNHDRNSGALELLLVTPLPVESIVKAQRMAMRTHFRRAIWTLCLLNAALIATVFLFSGPLDITGTDFMIFTELFIGGMVALLTDFEASIWVGMWHGLSNRQASKAIIRTALQLLGPGWIFTFLLYFMGPFFGRVVGIGSVFAIYFAVGWVVDFLSLDRARNRLLAEMRSVAAQRYDKVE